MGGRSLLYRDMLRAPLRQALVGVWPRHPSAKRAIVVAGLPRSGTSWVAKALSLARGVSYYFEPDHNLGKVYHYKYLPVDTEDENLRRHVDASLSGNITDDYVIAEQGIREILRRPFARVVLLKWVWLSLALDWVAERYPDMTIVQIIRHPVPQFLSWAKRDWDPDFSLKMLLAQPALMAGPLSPYAAVMKRADTYWEKAGALWGAVATMQYQAHRPGWFLLEHEWYCTNPEHHFQWLCHQLGLQWRDEIREFLLPDRVRVSGPGYGPRRDPSSEIDKWRGRVSQAQLSELASVLNEFDLPFYRELEPKAFWQAPPL